MVEKKDSYLTGLYFFYSNRCN